MSNPISNPPESGTEVVVTDGAYSQTVTWFDGHWRDGSVDGGWYEFSDSATWDLPGVATPKPTSAPKPAPTVAPAVAAAEEAVKAAEDALAVAETATGA